MSKFFEVWIINALSLWVIERFSAAVAFSDYAALAVTALALTILNMTIKPLLKVLAFPLTAVTFGLFSFVINGLVLFAAFQFSDGSSIASFGSAIWISIILAFLNGVFEKLFVK
ncbi:MAG: phage holin family protein [Solobacterium sp.]|nr:phage holin family protein [Solobacterium sp.]